MGPLFDEIDHLTNRKIQQTHLMPPLPLKPVMGSGKKTAVDWRTGTGTVVHFPWL